MGCCSNVSGSSKVLYLHQVSCVYANKCADMLMNEMSYKNVLITYPHELSYASLKGINIGYLAFLMVFVFSWVAGKLSLLHNLDQGLLSIRASYHKLVINPVGIVITLAILTMLLS